MDPRGNIASNGLRDLFDVGTCLQSHSLAMGIFSVCAVLALSPHVTLLTFFHSCMEVPFSVPSNLASLSLLLCLAFEFYASVLQGEEMRLGFGILMKIGSLESRRKRKRRSSCPLIQWALVPRIQALRFFTLV
jgi:hypothetical protein